SKTGRKAGFLLLGAGHQSPQYANFPRFVHVTGGSATVCPSIVKVGNCRTNVRVLPALTSKVRSIELGSLNTTVPTSRESGVFLPKYRAWLGATTRPGSTSLIWRTSI